ncbi:MAG: metallophosphoesterase [Myxococcales bacterium]|nr:metallophosphoesterase [Myxococcales bacterium]
MGNRWLTMAIFLAVVVGVMGGVHWLLWARFARDPAWSGAWGRGLGWLFPAMFAALPLTMVLVRVAPRAVVSPLAWVAFVWMGATLYLFLSAAAISAAVPLALKLGVVDVARRQWLSRAFAAGAGALSLGLTGWGVARALGPWVVREVRVPIARLGLGLEGFSIVQLTDIHVGPTVDRAYIAALVARVNALAPDLVVITGDLVDGSVAELAEHVAPLAGLRAAFGTYFVTGNHEYYSGANEWMDHLETLGLRVLRNQRVNLVRGGDGFDLAGVHDLSARRTPGAEPANLAKALEAYDPARPLVLLAHQPKQANEAADAGADLVLSGHTHGGQLWPFSWLVKLDQPYLAGLHRRGKTHIYVSEGTGYWGPPMRVGTSPEITRVVLARG